MPQTTPRGLGLGLGDDVLLTEFDAVRRRIICKYGQLRQNYMQSSNTVCKLHRGSIGVRELVWHRVLS